ncbi:hypothetical protein GW796_06790 [archaeon]|nr:hypothetical protein [archaeon]
MIKIRKSNSKFIFFEANGLVSVYKNNEKIVEKISEFKLDEISRSLEELINTNIEVLKSENTWICNAKFENFEKAPLGKEEMLTYAKWKIQELIDIPLHDIYYDVLTNNSSENNFFKKYASAVIIKKSYVDEISLAFGKFKIPLLAVDYTGTGLLDFFAKRKEFVENKSIAFLKMEKDKFFMCVYTESGMVFDRAMEIPSILNVNELNDNVEAILNKIYLEVQRNVDFLDRQYGIQHFENIVFSLPDGEICDVIKTKIAEYFSVKTVNMVDYLTVSAKEGTNIPVDVLALFERGSFCLEHINLLPKIDKKSSLKDDLKIVLLASVMVGVIFAVVGGVYEWKYGKIKIEISNMEKEILVINKRISVNRSFIEVREPELQQEISKLIQNKNEILNLNSQSTSLNKLMEQKVLEDIARTATYSSVVLSKIIFNDDGLLLEGTAKNKELFTNFLINLQKTENLTGKSLDSMMIESKNEIFEFKISSNKMGGK